MPDPSLLGDRLKKLLQVKKFPPPAGFAARSVVSDPDRYVQTYFGRFGPRGHRLSTAEIESALVSHPAVRTPCLVSAGKR